MRNIDVTKLIAELDASGQVSITFAQPEAYLMERLMLLGELRLAVHNAFEAEKAEVERTWQAGMALAAQRRAAKAGEAPSMTGWPGYPQQPSTGL